jgi:hypothetical protein
MTKQLEYQRRNRFYCRCVRCGQAAIEKEFKNGSVCTLAHCKRCRKKVNLINRRYRARKMERESCSTL